MIPSLKNPIAAQIGSRIAAPKTQRQNTTLVTGWPDKTTNRPMVPEITIALAISITPRIFSVMVRPSL